MKQSQPFYLLLASAFVLSGLLIVSIQGKSLLPDANAEMVVTRANITALTVPSIQGEALMITDNISKTLLVYELQAVGARGRIELKKAVYLPMLFPQQAQQQGQQQRRKIGGRIPR